MSDNDGIDDALRNAAQLTAGMLARLGEAQSRATQQHAIDQEHLVTSASTRAEQQAPQAAAQEEVAMARLRLVHDPAWWASATIGQVGDTWQIAHAYRGRQDADAAREIMTREITTRWGLSPETDADSVTVCRLLEQAEQDRLKRRAEDGHDGSGRGAVSAVREETECEERQAQSDRPPQREVVIVTEVATEVEQANAQVDNLDRQREHPYDSAKGRQSRAERYAQSGNHRAAEARILADEANALHPTYATRARLSRRRRISRGPCQPRPRYRIVGDLRR